MRRKNLTFLPCTSIPSTRPGDQAELRKRGLALQSPKDGRFEGGAGVLHEAISPDRKSACKGKISNKYDFPDWEIWLSGQGLPSLLGVMSSSRSDPLFATEFPVE